VANKPFGSRALRAWHPVVIVAAAISSWPPDHRNRPPPHVGTTLSLCGQRCGEVLVTFHSLAPRLTPTSPLPRPSFDPLLSAATTAPHHRPSQGSGPLSSPIQVALPSSSSLQPTTSGERVHRAATFLHEPHHRPPTSDLL
jgi:hypothetical protein